jgi:hypothetical protein
MDKGYDNNRVYEECASPEMLSGGTAAKGSHRSRVADPAPVRPMAHPVSRSLGRGAGASRPASLTTPTGRGSTARSSRPSTACRVQCARPASLRHTGADMASIRGRNGPARSAWRCYNRTGLPEQSAEGAESHRGPLAAGDDAVVGGAPCVHRARRAVQYGPRTSPAQSGGSRERGNTRAGCRSTRIRRTRTDRPRHAHGR